MYFVVCVSLPLSLVLCMYVMLWLVAHRHVVLDEADQMLEKGFADSVEEIMAASFKRTEMGGNLISCNVVYCAYASQSIIH